MFGSHAPITQDARLRECNYGNLNGSSSEQVQSMMRDCVLAPYPGGEGLTDVERRIRSFLDNLLPQFDEKGVALVSHKAPQLALEVIIGGKTWLAAIAQDWRLKQPPAWELGWEYVYSR